MAALFLQLRKVAGSISAKEWTLLGLETLGVLLGILIAFQLDGWAGSVREAREQKSLTERLLSEAEKNVAALRSEREFFRQRDDMHYAAMDRIFNHGQCTEQEWEDLGTIGFYPAIPVSSTVYDEMLGAGGLRLLPKASLREAVGNFYSSIESYRNQQDFFRNATLQSLSELGKADGLVTGLDMERRKFSIDYSTLANACEDRAFISKVAGAVRNSAVMQDWRRGLVAESVKMCAALAEELDTECNPADGEPLQGKDLEVAREAMS